MRLTLATTAAFCLLGTLAATGHAQTLTFDSTVYGLRGQTVPVKATLRNSQGAPMANQIVKGSWISDRGITNNLGNFVTDGNGRVTFSFTISTNVADDNINIRLWWSPSFNGGGASYIVEAKTRVQVGRPYP